jgi:glutathione peroxidase-family protein
MLAKGLFSNTRTVMATSAYNFVVKDSKGGDFDLKQLAGSVTLVMNVASKCGYTKKGYTAATEMYEKYEGQPFRVLAFPCNQFGGQEPGTNEEIAEFACNMYKAKFPLMDKVDVNGDGAIPFYKYIKKEKTGILGTEGVKWNFTYFVIDKAGKTVERFAPGASSKELDKVIAPLMASA